MTAQENTITLLARRLEKLGVAFMLIGGHAVAVWGTPRATLDVDITIWASDADAERIVDQLAPDFDPLVNDPGAFVRETRVLPLRSRDGVRVDLIFGLLPFEQKAIERSQPITLEGVRVPVVSAEDLILMKIVSDRPHDLLDVESIVARRMGELDFDYLEPRISEFADAMESQDIRERWMRLVARLRKRDA